jgi:hypothetical protein
VKMGQYDVQTVGDGYPVPYPVYKVTAFSWGSGSGALPEVGGGPAGPGADHIVDVMPFT